MDINSIILNIILLIFVIYSLYAVYVFTCFTNNYDREMGMNSITNDNSGQTNFTQVNQIKIVAEEEKRVTSNQNQEDAKAAEYKPSEFANLSKLSNKNYYNFIK